MCFPLLRTRVRAVRSPRLLNKASILRRLGPSVSTICAGRCWFTLARGESPPPPCSDVDSVVGVATAEDGDGRAGFLQLLLLTPRGSGVRRCASPIRCWRGGTECRGRKVVRSARVRGIPDRAKRGRICRESPCAQRGRPYDAGGFTATTNASSRQWRARGVVNRNARRAFSGGLYTRDRRHDATRFIGLASQRCRRL